MSYLHTLIIYSCAFLIGGCASYPRSTEDQLSHHAREALTAASKGDRVTAAIEIDTLLDKPRGEAKAREVVQQSPVVGDYYVDYLIRRAVTASSVPGLESVQTKIATSERAGLFTPVQASSLRKGFGDAVLGGLGNGTLPLDLGDIYRFPALKEANQQFLATKAIESLRRQGSAGRSEKLAALLDYAARHGKDSNEFLQVEASLPSMGIKKSELPALAEVFPKYALTRKAELSTPVFLTVTGGDRLWRDDLMEAINKRLGNVPWAKAPGDGVTTLNIEKARFEERVLPERTETITYAQYQVNTAAAVLLMPRNATYSYELISGGASIDYGIVVTATLNGQKTHDQVIRGKVGANYRRCINSRIKNVFGGESAAGFTANDDMKGRCSGDPETSIEALRDQVFEKVIAGIIEVPVVNSNP